MKKLTKNQRVEVMSKGFKRAGAITNGTLKSFGLARDSYETIFAKMNEELNEPNLILKLATTEFVSVEKVRSKDFIDTSGVYHDLKGSTYLLDNLLIHDYGNTDDYGIAMNIYVLA